MAIDVGEFRQTHPAVIFQVFDVILKESCRTVAIYGRIQKVDNGLNVETIEPDPFWSIVIAKAMSRNVII